MPGLLLVDDSPSLRAALKLYLQELAFASVKEAGNGQEGLDVARVQRPQLIIVDLMMPVMDGIQFLLELRADPKLADTKVIVLSANEDQTERIAAYPGPHTYVATKPVTSDSLKAVVRRALGPLV